MDWMNIPLDEFHGKSLVMSPVGGWEYPHGQNVSTQIMASFEADIENAFSKYLPDDDATFEKYEHEGLVPILRNGQWVDEEVDSFTLSDLPDILYTLIVLEEEQKERKKAEQRKRRNARARERRKLVKLGEW